MLFPGSILPLRVFEPRYMDMVKTCMQEEKPFGICLIKEGTEVGTPAVPETVGCMARIVEWDMEQLGVLHLKVEGTQRFTVIGSGVEPNGLVTAQAKLIPAEKPLPLQSEHRICATVLQRIAAQVGEKNFARPFHYDDTVWVGYRLAQVLPLKLSVRQDMLEMNDSLVRIEVLHRFLSRQGLAG